MTNILNVFIFLLLFSCCASGQSFESYGRNIGGGSRDMSLISFETKMGIKYDNIEMLEADKLYVTIKTQDGKEKKISRVSITEKTRKNIPETYARKAKAK